jgi:hypothetical protein
VAKPLSVISKNCKTFKSLDLSTDCPKRRTNNSCPYCYVEAARKASFRAKTIYQDLPYKNEILRMRPQTLIRLNNCGGLRIFSFGDYMNWMDKDLDQVISDANVVGLRLKAITKVPEFVKKYAEKINTINVSVDTIGHGMPWDIAKDLRSRYKNVWIRSAILFPCDVEELEWTDIMTLFHGRAKGFHHFTKNEKQKLYTKYPDKFCCITGKCITCSLKCRSLEAQESSSIADSERQFALT